MTGGRNTTTFAAIWLLGFLLAAGALAACTGAAGQAPGAGTGTTQSTANSGEAAAHSSDQAMATTIGEPFCTPVATTTDATAGSIPPVTLVPTNPGLAGVIRNADVLAANGKTAEAKELYVAVLGSETVDDIARQCAAAGLGRIALDEKKALTNPLLAADSEWSTFVTTWLTPAWNLLLPFVITMAVLLFLTKGVTRLFVDPAAKGPEDRTRERRALWWYALYGWVPMLIAAWLLVIGVPGATERSSLSHGAPLLLATIVILILATAAVCILSQTVGAWKQMAPWTTTIVAVGVLSVGLAILTWCLDRPGVATLAIAVLAAGVGTLVAGFFRGLRQDMVIQGRKSDGSDDAGLAQAIQAALNGVGSIPPRGVTVPVNTDVSELQKDALAVLPEGAWAKIGTFLVSLVTPSRPWRVVISHLDTMSINVVLTRNGRSAETQVIRPVDYGWLPINGDIAAAKEKDDGKQDGSAPTSIDLCRAAAAYIILVLADRHPELKPGLNGATKWRSVAAQVVATTPRTVELLPTQRRALLAHAVAVDDANLAAQLAFAYERYTQRPEDNADLIKALQTLWGKIIGKDVEAIKRALSDPGQPWEPKPKHRALQIRLLFNMTVAMTNSYISGNASAGQKARDYRSILAHVLDASKSDPNLVGLIAETRSSAFYLGAALEPKTQIVAASRSGILSFYQASCAHTHRKEWAKALDALEICCFADPSYGTWAQTDPSYAGLQAGFGVSAWSSDDSNDRIDGGPTFAELQRFRKTVGTSSPADFLELDGLSDYAKQLTGLGVTSAEQVLSRGKHWLMTYIGISRPMAQRWIDIATLYLATPIKRRSIVFLLLKSEVSSLEALRLAVNDKPGRAELAKKLAENARGGDIVPPSAAAWQDIPWTE